MTTFNEREAIRLEMEEIKEQNRRDFEVYLDSRNFRNKRYAELQDRLRYLDERGDIIPEATPPVVDFSNLTPLDESIEEKLKLEPDYNTEETQDEPRLEFAQLQSIPAKSPVQKRIKEEMLNTKKRQRVVPTERLVPVVIDFLATHKHKPQKLKDIQRHVEAKLDNHWVNFSGALKKVVASTNKIKKLDKGLFIYNVDNQIAE